MEFSISTTIVSRMGLLRDIFYRGALLFTTRTCSPVFFSGETLSASLYNLKVAYARVDSPALLTTSTPTSITTLATPASPLAVAIAEPGPAFSCPRVSALTTLAVTSTTSATPAEPFISVGPGTSPVIYFLLGFVGLVVYLCHWRWDYYSLLLTFFCSNWPLIYCPLRRRFRSTCLPTWGSRTTSLLLRYKRTK